MSDINVSNIGQNQSVTDAQNAKKERNKKILKGVAIGVGTIALFAGARYLHKSGVFNRNLNNASVVKNAAKEIDLKPLDYEARFKELSDMFEKEKKIIMAEMSEKAEQSLKEMREKFKKLTEEMYVNSEKDFQKAQKEVISDINEFFKF